MSTASSTRAPQSASDDAPACLEGAIETCGLGDEDPEHGYAKDVATCLSENACSLGDTANLLDDSWKDFYKCASKHCVDKMGSCYSEDRLQIAIAKHYGFASTPASRTSSLVRQQMRAFAIARPRAPTRRLRSTSIWNCAWHSSAMGKQITIPATRNPLASTVPTKLICATAQRTRNRRIM